MRHFLKYVLLSLTLLCLLLFSQWAQAFSFHTAPASQALSKSIGPFQASPFSLVPYGTLPTRVVTGGSVDAYYTVTNKYSRALSGQTLFYPKNTTLVTTGSGICAQQFTLGAGESCRVQLRATGEVNNYPVLYVCDSTGVNCVGNGNNPLIVRAISLLSISIVPSTSSMPKGTAKQYQAFAAYSDGSRADITDEVSWRSSNTAIATIGATGLAVGAGTGSVTISASLYGVTSSASLTITAATLSSIAVTPNNPSAKISVGYPVAYTAVGTYSDGTTQTITSSVTWASSNTSIATITSGGIATGVSGGGVSISAILSGVSGSASLTVTTATVTHVEVLPVAASIANGLTQQFTAKAYFSDGTSAVITAYASWASSNTTHATVNSTGLATGVGVGTANIIATFEGHSDSGVLTVTDATMYKMTISPSTPPVPQGATQQFTAQAYYSDGSAPVDVTNLATWSSSDTSKVTISNTSGTQGLATAVSLGSSTIQASYNGFTPRTVMTVTNATLIRIVVTPSNKTVPNGKPETYTATGYYSDGPRDITNSVTWTSSKPSVATIASTGVATVVANSGSTTITATAGTVSGSTKLNAEPAELDSITVTPYSAYIPQYQSYPYTATGTYSDGSTLDITSQVTWSVSVDPSAFIVDSSGLVLAVASQGVAHINASLGAHSAYGTATVATLESLTITPANPSVTKGSTQQFTATATFNGIPGSEDVTLLSNWLSSKPSVATINPRTGLAAAISTTDSPTTISATYLNNPPATTTMAVTNLTPISLAVVPSTHTLSDGSSLSLAAIVTFSDGSIANVTNSSTWTSSNSSLDSVTSGPSTWGVVTSHSASDSATITATYQTLSGYSTITNSPATVTSVTLDPDPTHPPSINVGQNTAFTATAHYSDASTQPVTTTAAWVSTDPSVASVISGGSQAGTVTGEAAGSVNITASYDGQTSLPTQVTVTAPLLQSITISGGPENGILLTSSTSPYVATGHYSDGTTQNITTSVTWASSDGTVATISNTSGTQGRATALGGGSTIISATSGSIVGTAVLQVSTGASFAIGNTAASGGTQEPLGFFGNLVGSLWTSSAIESSSSSIDQELLRVRFAPYYSGYFSVGTAPATNGGSGLVYSTTSTGQVNPAVTLLDTRMCTGGGTFHGISASGVTGNNLVAGGWCTSSSGIVPMTFTSSNGTSWTYSTTPPSRASSATSEQLFDLACDDQTSACNGVGDAVVSGKTQAIYFNSIDNGVNWATQTLSPPALCVNSTLSAISHVHWTTPEIAQVAVGTCIHSDGSQYPLSYSNSNPDFSTNFNSPTPLSTTDLQLNDISCAAASGTNYCVAVGSYVNSQGNSVPLVYRTNEGHYPTWENNGNLVTVGVALEGVSCEGASCIAVGSANEGTESAVYYSSDSGATWTAQTAPTSPLGLFGVAYHS